MVPGSPTLVTATLSVTIAVNVTVWLCDEVLSETVESSALKLVIDGSWSSLFVILTVTDCVELFPRYYSEKQFFCFGFSVLEQKGSKEKFQN